MKALYSKCGDTIFELNETPLNSYDLADIRNKNIAYKWFQGTNTVSIRLDLGLINEDFKTNKEVIDENIQYLKDNKITSLRRLDPLYEIACDFTLFDENRKKIIDEGVMVRHIIGKEISRFRVLGVSEDNELHHRIVKEFEGEFNWKYLQSVPCGIIGSPRYDYTLVINKIYIHQLINDPDRFKNVHDSIETYHKSSEGVCITRETFATSYNRPEDIVIFDSAAESIKIDPIRIEDKMANLNLNINLVLNNYFEVYDEETINAILTENSTVEPPEVTREVTPDVAEEPRE